MIARSPTMNAAKICHVNHQFTCEKMLVGGTIFHFTYQVNQSIHRGLNAKTLFII